MKMSQRNLGSIKVFFNSTWGVNIFTPTVSCTYHQFSLQLRPTAPPLMHLSSRLPSDVALVMCPRRLLSSRPTSLLHCSILLSAPGLCPLLDSPLSLSLSLSASCSLWTSSGKEERFLWLRDFSSPVAALWTNPNNLLISLIMNESILDECVLLYHTVEAWAVSREGKEKQAVEGNLGQRWGSKYIILQYIYSCTDSSGRQFCQNDEQMRYKLQ